MPDRRRSYRSADIALLWSRSGGLCSFPECYLVCVQEANNGDKSAIFGEVAHIEASSDRGPRSNPSLTARQRDEYPNLVLLCPTHHRIVDARESAYTADVLRRWKRETEERFYDLLAGEIANISYAELETVTRALVNSEAIPPSSISVIPPLEKLTRNGLTERSVDLFNIGLLKSRQVQQFVEEMSGLDSTFPARLTSDFVNEYRQKKQAGLKGDSLFESLRLFSAQGRSDIRYQCAGLAVLVYLFERCEVFEK